MPVIQINVWSGLHFGKKKKTVIGITNVFDEIGIQREAIIAIISEETKENLT